MEEHKTHIKRIFELLKELDLVVSEKKCEWGQDELIFLGHTVNGDGIKVENRKIQKIVDWPTPSNITELCQGSPRKGAAILWGREQEESFLHLKRELTNTVLLNHPKPFAPFVLDTDASGQNVGAVLQQDPDAQEITKEFSLEAYSKIFKSKNLKPIAYESRKLLKTEQNYSAQERELLATVHALKHFRGYMEGLPVLVRTDHKSLKYFKSQRHVNRRLARFVDKIEFFDTFIIYRPGPKQMAADSLSCKPNCLSDIDPPEIAEPLFLLENDMEEAFTKLENLRVHHPSELKRKGFKFANNVLYGPQPGGQSVPVITDLNKARTIARETHVRLGHRNAKDTLYQRPQQNSLASD
ncbi:hypothetical protein MJO29_013773 [Puccinia striiformis f. sp. tritici]|nr:hypothetical protein MJO29_013773 [Puccinia striiformis f. sp. tritici]